MANGGNIRTKIAMLCGSRLIKFEDTKGNKKP